MRFNHRDTRVVGVSAAALIAVLMALPWVTISGPFIGSVGISGYKSGGDGYLFLAVLTVLAVLAWFRLRRTSGIVVALVGVGLAADYAYMATEFHRQNTDGMFTIQPGLGLILGVAVAGAVAAWTLIGLRGR